MTPALKVVRAQASMQAGRHATVPPHLCPVPPLPCLTSHLVVSSMIKDAAAATASAVLCA